MDRVHKGGGVGAWDTVMFLGNLPLVLMIRMVKVVSLVVVLRLVTFQVGDAFSTFCSGLGFSK